MSGLQVRSGFHGFGYDSDPQAAPRPWRAKPEQQRIDSQAIADRHAAGAPAEYQDSARSAAIVAIESQAPVLALHAGATAAKVVSDSWAHQERRNRVKTAVDQESMALSHRLGLPGQDCARILSWAQKHAPPEMGEDIRQEIACQWLRMAPGTALEAASVATRVVNHAWDRTHNVTKRTAYSLDSARLLELEERLATDGPALDDGIDYADLAVSNVVARDIWHTLPGWVQYLVARQLAGDNVGAKLPALRRWAREHMPLLVAQLAAGEVARQGR